MNIRRVCIGEELALHDVYSSAIRLVASRDYTPQQIEAWAMPDIDPERWIRRIRGINPFVAEEDGEIVGYADVQSDGYIDHFFVSGRHPRRGVGRALMHVLHDEAKRLEVQALTSNVSRTAQPFFAHFGFKLVERRLVTVDGVALEIARMEKRLAGTFT